ncbi:MAG: GNAT family N-acetyltransferase [Tahibacter sp.]
MKSSAATPTMTSRAYRSSTRPPVRSPIAPTPGSAPLPGEEVVLRDGRRLILRPIHASDAPALQRGFAHLSQEEVRMRFLHLLTELPDALAQRLCDLDPAHEVAFVIVDPLEVGEPEVHAVARAYFDPATNAAEFALVVQKALSGQGLGDLLMRHLLDACRASGADEIWGDVLAENHLMLSLCEHLGFERAPAHHDPGLIRVSMKI